EFLSATDDARLKILLDHAEKNNNIIRIRRLKTMQQNNEKQYEEISKQFEEFCHTKGIVAKFKVAFANMAENTRKQKEADKKQLEEVKKQSAENNPEFTELLHTKGFKAKVQLIIANIKKGAKEASAKTAAAVDRVSAQTKANIAKVQTSTYRTTTGHESPAKNTSEYTAEDLSREFNEFLKTKGLDGKYVVEVTGEDYED
ncbi:MAG: hypothetical protein K2K50_00260, partial [Anaeroplasmataceae bacterium]|nr:hypothetical protein [Anaeroplasmataceae bacterium]